MASETNEHIVQRLLQLPKKQKSTSNNKLENIYSWAPPTTNPQWWVTGFSPEEVGKVDANKLVHVSCVDFSQFTENGVNDMYQKFWDNNKGKSTILFYDVNYTIWFMW